MGDEYILRVTVDLGTSQVRPFSGQVAGDFPASCHGGFRYQRGRLYCQQKGHRLPPQVEWDVEAPWNDSTWERWSRSTDGEPGPTRFATPPELIEVAIGRFLGQWELRAWEAVPVQGRPGDRLWLTYVPEERSGRRYTGWPSFTAHGSLLAEVPPAMAIKPVLWGHEKALGTITPRPADVAGHRPRHLVGGAPAAQGPRG